MGEALKLLLLLSVVNLVSFLWRKKLMIRNCLISGRQCAYPSSYWNFGIEKILWRGETIELLIESIWNSNLSNCSFRVNTTRKTPVSAMTVKNVATSTTSRKLILPIQTLHNQNKNFLWISTFYGWYWCQKVKVSLITVKREGKKACHVHVGRCHMVPWKTGVLFKTSDKSA